MYVPVRRKALRRAVPGLDRRGSYSRTGGWLYTPASLLGARATQIGAAAPTMSALEIRNGHPIRRSPQGRAASALCRSTRGSWNGCAEFSRSYVHRVTGARTTRRLRLIGALSMHAVAAMQLGPRAGAVKRGHRVSRFVISQFPAGPRGARLLVREPNRAGTVRMSSVASSRLA